MGSVSNRRAGRVGTRREVQPDGSHQDRQLQQGHIWRLPPQDSRNLLT